MEVQQLEYVRRRAADPSAEQVAIQKIIDETHFNVRRAKRVLAWTKHQIVEARSKKGLAGFIDGTHMKTDEYETFAQLVPPGSTAAPGSAHEAIERALLEDCRGERALRHEVVDGKPTICLLITVAA